jgi:hypothetical protein
MIDRWSKKTYLNCDSIGLFILANFDVGIIK